MAQSFDENDAAESITRIGLGMLSPESTEQNLALPRT